jgi:hypothetical protein
VLHTKGKVRCQGQRGGNKQWFDRYQVVLIAARPHNVLEIVLDLLSDRVGNRKLKLARKSKIGDQDTRKIFRRIRLTNTHTKTQHGSKQGSA